MLICWASHNKAYQKWKRKKNISDEQIAEAAKVLDVTKDFIKNFDERVVVNNNFLFNDNIINPVKEVIDYFKDELLKKDEEKDALKDEIESLKAELESLRGSSSKLDNVKNIGRKAE